MRRLARWGLRALCLGAVAVVAIAVYARVTRSAPSVTAEPTVPFAWVEPWYTAPVVTVTEEEIRYQGQLLAMVESVRDRDGPTFRIESLEARLRADTSDLDPASPHARRRSAHTAMCLAAQLARIDRRILCAGRFLVVELDGAMDREVIGKIVMTAENLGYSVVLTFRRSA
jgi:hypothetical protein